MTGFNKHYTYKELLKYTFPSIVMIVFTSIYGVVDGLFLSNYAGKDAFAAVNFILPFLLVLNGVGFMFGSGGSALVAKIMGEGDIKKANNVFSSLVFTSIFTGVALTLIGFFAIKPLAVWLGADGILLSDSLIYGKIYLFGITPTIIQYEFQNLFVTADKPKLGLYSTVGSGVANIVLDALFVAVFSWGLEGAAYATVISQFIGGMIPIVYFSRKNSSTLKIVKSKFEGSAMIKVCTNGFSELLNNISMSIVSMIYNAQLLKYAGNNGLASYGALMYINFMFISVFIGYVVGVSPIISYHYGAKNRSEIKSLLKKSYVLLGFCSLVMFLISELLANPVSSLFVGYDSELFDMTLKGFFIFSFSFLFSGFAIFGSSFFTALNNGLLSTIISTARTVVFQISLVMLLPIFMGVSGIWLSVVIAEFLAALLGGILIILKRKTYKY